MEFWHNTWGATEREHGGVGVQIMPADEGHEIQGTASGLNAWDVRSIDDSTEGEEEVVYEGDNSWLERDGWLADYVESTEVVRRVGPQEEGGNPYHSILIRPSSRPKGWTGGGRGGPIEMVLAEPS